MYDVPGIILHGSIGTCVGYSIEARDSIIDQGTTVLFTAVPPCQCAGTDCACDRWPKDTHTSTATAAVPRGHSSAERSRLSAFTLTSILHHNAAAKAVTFMHHASQRPAAVEAADVALLYAV